MFQCTLRILLLIQISFQMSFFLLILIFNSKVKYFNSELAKAEIYKN